MEDINNQQINQRDYDKEPIVIKNYAVYYQGAFFFMLALVLIYLWIGDFQNGRFEQMDFSSFEFFRIIVSIGFIIWLVIFMLKLPKRFKNLPSTFTFTNKFISHVRYLYEKDTYSQKKYFEVDIKEVLNVNYCVMTEFPYQYGRWHYLTSWQLYRKSSIGVHIGKTTLFVRHLITYILFVLPYKIYRLLKAEEPLSLLSKNIFIRFSNRNYFLVNIYSQKELDELMAYFKVHNIQIIGKTYFFPHLQNDGWFVDKNEVWSDEFNQKEEEK
ncbi:MAG: hypothetical protein P8Y49_06665 [Sulfurovaceae bacterium]